MSNQKHNHRLKFPRSMTHEQKLYVTIDKLSRLKCASLFTNPVNLELYPDYDKIISKPIDYSTIKSKIKQGKYKYMVEVYSDLKLMAKNCFQYNKGKPNQLQINKLLARYLNSVEVAWQGFKNELKQCGTDQYEKISNSKEMQQKINQIEEKMQMMKLKKIERLSGRVQIKPVILNNQKDAKKEQSDDQQNDIKVDDKNINEMGEYANEATIVMLSSGNVPITTNEDASFNNKQLEKVVQEQLSERQDTFQERQQTNFIQNLHFPAKEVKYDWKTDKYVEQCNEDSRTQTITETMKHFPPSKTTSQQVAQPKQNEPTNSHKDAQLNDNHSYNRQQNQRSAIKQPQQEHSDEQKPQQKVQQQNEQSKRSQIQEQFNNMIKYKLCKYQTIIKNYLIWLQINIIDKLNEQPQNNCQQHYTKQKQQIENEDSNRNQCEDCRKYKKEVRLYKEYAKMRTPNYLSNYLSQQLQTLSKGEISLKSLLRLLKQFNLWIKLLIGPYLQWRVKEKFVKIEANIIKCLHKILEYKELGGDFWKILEQRIQENNKLYQHLKKIQKSDRVTRSKSRNISNNMHNLNVSINTSIDYEKMLTNCRQSKRKYSQQPHESQVQNLAPSELKRIQNKLRNLIHEANNEEVQEISASYQQFLNILQKDQVYNDFKIEIVSYKGSKQKLQIVTDKDIGKQNKKLKKRCIKVRKNRKFLKQKIEVFEQEEFQQSRQQEQQQQHHESQQQLQNVGECHEQSVQAQGQQDDEFSVPQRHKEQQTIRKPFPMALEFTYKEYFKTKKEEKIRDDKQFLYEYALRSNTMIIEKYQDRIYKLEINWDQIMERKFGGIPKRISFDEESTGMAESEEDCQDIFKD